MSALAPPLLQDDFVLFFSPISQEKPDGNVHQTPMATTKAIHFVRNSFKYPRSFHFQEISKLDRPNKLITTPAKNIKVTNVHLQKTQPK